MTTVYLEDFQSDNRYVTAYDYYFSHERLHLTHAKQTHVIGDLTPESG